MSSSVSTHVQYSVGLTSTRMRDDGDWSIGTGKGTPHQAFCPVVYSVRRTGWTMAETCVGTTDVIL